MKIAILGGGPGGYVAAIKAAQLGAHVTVIEKAELGGTCLNWGCIPTKALLASATALRKAKDLRAYGIEVNGTIMPNFSSIMERKSKIVSTQTKGIRSLLKSWQVELIEGRGRLTSPSSLEVEKPDGTKMLVEADRIIIATGSRPARIPSLPFDGKQVLSSDDALRLSAIPASMLIIGAGVIGSEFACIFSEFGTAVTMVDILAHAVATEDREISEHLGKELKKKKIKLITSTGVERLECRDDGVHSFLTNGTEIITEKVLVSIGRSLNTEDIGIESLGIARGKKNKIAVNARMETNVSGVFAVGDVTGGLLLAHVASREGIVAAMNATGTEATMDYRVVPAAVFTSPEIASVGLREQEAVEQGISVKIGRFPFRALGKAHAAGEISGLFKVISDARTDLLLGVHIIGAHASDIIHEAAIAIQAGMKTDAIIRTIHAHPTLSEGLLEAAADLHDSAIHAAKK